MRLFHHILLELAPQTTRGWCTDQSRFEITDTDAAILGGDSQFIATCSGGTQAGRDGRLEALERHAVQATWDLPGLAGGPTIAVKRDRTGRHTYLTPVDEWMRDPDSEHGRDSGRA